MNMYIFRENIGGGRNPGIPTQNGLVVFLRETGGDETKILMHLEIFLEILVIDS